MNKWLKDFWYYRIHGYHRDLDKAMHEATFVKTYEEAVALQKKYPKVVKEIDDEKIIIIKFIIK